MSSTEQQGFEIMVAAFQDENSADQILAELKAAHQDKLANIEDVAVIRKEDDGRIHIKETDDMGGGKGAGIGALVGGAIGLLGGPVGVLAGAGLGAAVGGLAAKLHDAGIDDDRLRQIGDALAPGTSAIVAVVGKQWKDEVRSTMSKEARQVFTAELADDIAIQLRQGGEVAYAVGKDATSTTIERIAATAGTVTAGAVAVSEEGLRAGQVVVDETGAIVRGLEADSTGVTVGEALLDEAGNVIEGGIATTKQVASGVADTAADAAGAVTYVAADAVGAAAEAADTAVDTASDVAKGVADAAGDAAKKALGS